MIRLEDAIALGMSVTFTDEETHRERLALFVDTLQWITSGLDPEGESDQQEAIQRIEQAVSGLLEQRAAA